MLCKDLFLFFGGRGLFHVMHNRNTVHILLYINSFIFLLFIFILHSLLYKGIYQYWENIHIKCSDSFETYRPALTCIYSAVSYKDHLISFGLILISKVHRYHVTALYTFMDIIIS